MKSAHSTNSRQAAFLQAELAKAIEFHRLQQLAEAEQIYRTILATDSRHFEAVALLGTIFLERNRFEEAAAQFSLAVQIRPEMPLAHVHLGSALSELGKLDAALASYDRAIALQPDFAEAFSNRGLILHDVNRLEEALASFNRAIALKPDSAEAFNNRGRTFNRMERYREGLVSCNRAIELKPDCAEAFNNRGAALLALKRFKEALESFDLAIALKPNHADAFNNVGLLFHELGRFDEAIGAFDHAIAAKPDYAAAFSNRGNALRELKRLEDSLASYDKAIALDPNFGPAFTNRGNVLSELKRLDEALASYDRAVALMPEDAEAISNRSRLRLLFGRFAQGWEDFEQRWGTHKLRSVLSRNRDYQALSLGAKQDDLRNKHVLVVAEQGVGDEIMFASMIPDLIEDVKDVAVECDFRLAGLFGRSFPSAEIIPSKSPPNWNAADFDCCLPAGSLGRLYRRSLQEFPQRRSYLKPDAAIVAKWRSRLSSLGAGFKVGISWKGGSERTRTHARSIPLQLWRPILELEDARFVSLQYGDAEAEIDQANRYLSRPVTRFEREEIDDFDQLAGLVSSLDVVISVQTALVHLSGAIGHPCWVMVPYAPEWRYGAEGSSMPWYDAVRLYRQTRHADWNETIAEVTSALAMAADARAHAPRPAQLV